MDKDTPIQRFRAPTSLWRAYGHVLKTTSGKSRSADLVDHMRDVIRRHGDIEDLVFLEEAEVELSARLARKHAGRPPKRPAGE